MSARVEIEALGTLIWSHVFFFRCVQFMLFLKSTCRITEDIFFLLKLVTFWWVFANPEQEKKKSKTNKIIIFCRSGAIDARRRIFCDVNPNKAIYCF